MAAKVYAPQLGELYRINELMKSGNSWHPRAAPVHGSELKAMVPIFRESRMRYMVIRPEKESAVWGISSLCFPPPFAEYVTCYIGPLTQLGGRKK